MSLPETIAHVRARIAAGDPRVTLTVAHPDRGRGCFPGEPIPGTDPVLRHRPLRVWVELAARLHLRLGGPHPRADGCVDITFEPLAAPGPTLVGDPTEKYGTGSTFERISKLEDPGFVIDFEDALLRMQLPPDAAVLDLGCNTAEAFDLVLPLHPRASLLGVDHSASALNRARERLPDPLHRFLRADLQDITDLPPERFDLVMAVCTLQSPGVDDRALLRHIVQERLTPRGSVLIVIPNCCYQDGEILHGARMKNFTQPDLSLLIKHAAYFRRYLQQHHRRVFITGHNYVFVTGVPR